jgi:hypothetical protein
VSDYMLEKPLLNPVGTAKEDESAFLRQPDESGGPERPRTFDAYMGQRQQGGRTRLQELRAKHGWSLFRSKNSAGGRAYRDALRAEKWRFTGGAALAKGGIALGEDGQVSDPGLARQYRAMKSGLKAAAGWRRFIPFTAARRDYKAALKSLRTGKGMTGQETGNGANFELTPFERLRNTSRYQRTVAQGIGARPEESRIKPDADTRLVAGLLGQQMEDPKQLSDDQLSDDQLSDDQSSDDQSDEQPLDDQQLDPQVGKVSETENLKDDDEDPSPVGEGSDYEDGHSDDDDQFEEGEPSGGEPGGGGEFKHFLMGMLPGLEAEPEERTQGA